MTSNKARICLRECIYFQLGRMAKLGVTKHVKMEISRAKRFISLLIDMKRVAQLRNCHRPSKLSKEDLVRWKKSAENQVGVAQWKLINKFSVSKTCFQRNLKRLNLKYCKKQKALKYSERQLEKIPRKYRKIRSEINDKEIFIIFDDRKYFLFGSDKVPGNAGFYTKV